ncbi:MAG: RodZ domain-containing protein [Thermodesulfobacteriota bacterium]
MDDLHSGNEEPLKESLGNLLKRTRESQNKTLAEVAEATRIHILSLQALEDDDFEKLPAEVFVRGFIKLYSNFLGLDQQKTLSHFSSREAPDAPYRHEILDGEVMAEPLLLIKKNGKIITVTLLLAVLVLFYALGIFFKSAEQSQPGQTAKEEVESLLSSNPPAEPEISPEGAEPASGSNKEAEPETAPPLQAISAGQEEEITTEPEKTTATPEPSTAAAREEPSPVRPTTVKPQTTTTSQRDQTLPVTVKVSTEPTATPLKIEKKVQYILEANFEESSQVTVKVDDEPEKKYHSQAGIVRVWKASSSISLALGNPAAVSLTLNGRPIPASYLADPASPLLVPADLPDNFLP